jgi:hypothetical protein
MFLPQKRPLHAEAYQASALNDRKNYASNQPLADHILPVANG